MSNFVQRTLSGTVYVAVIVASVLFHPLAFVAVFSTVSALTVMEYCRLMKIDRWLTVLSMLSAFMLFLAFSSLNPYSFRFSNLVYGGIVLFTLVAELFRAQPNPIRNWGNYLISQVMIALPFAYMNQILFSGGWQVGRYILLALFVCIWTNDTGAYCVGSLIGRHKMIPRVSPGKTWEGLIGGFVFAVLAGYIFSLFITDLPTWKWLSLAAIISVVGTLGDLMESIFKRTIGIKDSGNVVPGRGGFLDCFDSTLLATPVIAMILSL